MDAVTLMIRGISAVALAVRARALRIRCSQRRQQGELLSRWLVGVRAKPVALECLASLLGMIFRPVLPFLRGLASVRVLRI